MADIFQIVVINKMQDKYAPNEMEHKNYTALIKSIDCMLFVYSIF